MSLTLSRGDLQLLEGVEEHAHVADAGQVERGHDVELVRQVEGGQHDLGEGGRRVDDDVVELGPGRLDDPLDVDGVDPVGVGGVLGRRQHHDARSRG